MHHYLKLQYLRYTTLRAYRSGDWRKVPIHDTGQKLVQVPPEMTFPFYARVMGLAENERIYVREEVLEKLAEVRVRLQQKRFDLRVYDGWRSVELQESLFWFFMRTFTANRFGQKENFARFNNSTEVKTYFESLPPETQAVMREANRMYVSLPSSDPVAPSPHATGGAVDVWLVENGTEANLGIPFDWMEEEAGTFYHLKWSRKRFSGNDKKVCCNRSRLILSMTGSGFSCYGPELWHFNYGNQMDALVKGGRARYSYIEP